MAMSGRSVALTAGAALLGTAAGAGVAVTTDSTIQFDLISTHAVLADPAETLEPVCAVVDASNQVKLFSEAYMSTVAWNPASAMTGPTETNTAADTNWDKDQAYPSTQCVVSNGNVWMLTNGADPSIYWDDTDNAWKADTGSTRPTAAFEAALVAGDGNNVYAFGGSTVQGIVELVNDDGDYGTFMVKDTSNPANDWAEVAQQPTSMAGTRSSLMTYNSDENAIYLLGGLRFAASSTAGSPGTWTRVDEMMKYDIAAGTWGAAQDVPAGCVPTLTGTTYDSLHFNRQFQYVPQIRSLAILQTCQGEDESALYLYDLSVPAKYRMWTKAASTASFSTANLFLLKGTSSMFKADDSHLLITSATAGESVAQSIKFEGQEFCDDDAIADEWDDFVASSTYAGANTLMCALKKVTPAAFVLSDDADGTKNNKLEINWMIPEAFKNSQKYGFLMDIVQGSSNVADEAAQGCVQSFAGNAALAGTGTDYHTGLYKFTISDISAMLTACGATFSFTEEVNENQILSTIGQKFRLFVYALDTASTTSPLNLPDGANPTEYRSQAFLTKSFQAQLAYNTETKELVSVSVFDTDMGTITGTEQALNSELALMENPANGADECVTSKAIFTSTEAACARQTIELGNIFADVTSGVAAEVTLVRILDAAGTELLSSAGDAGNPLQNAANTGIFDLTNVAHVVYRTIGTTTLVAEAKFTVPDTCFGCQVEVTTKVTDGSRRLAEGDVEENHGKTITQRTALQVTPKSATNASKTVGSSSATRCTGAAALVAMAAGALAA